MPRPRKINWDKACLFVGCVTTEQGFPLLAQPQIHADLVEVRFDALRKAGMSTKKVIRKLRSRKNPVLLTLRTIGEGGEYKWKSTERVRCFKELIPFVDAIDLELHNVELVREVFEEARAQKRGIILSAHSIHRKMTYGRLVRWLELFRKYRVKVYKIASLARTQEDLNVLVRVLIDHPQLRLGVMAVGDMSFLSRRVLPALGSKLVYGYLDRPAAKNQPSIREVARGLPWLLEK